MRTSVVAALLFTACNIVRQAQVSPIAGAAREGDPTKIRELATRGADPNAPSGGNRWTPLLHAVHKHQNASVAALLNAGADVNRADEQGVTPLMMAAGYGYDDTVQLLLQRHADARVKRSNGETALDWAMSGMTDIDRFTFFQCQDSTAQLLRKAAPGVKPLSGARRWATMKRCGFRA
jgi:ankyrin repeat protein